jgi:uncharacterized membrane protein
MDLRHALYELSAQHRLDAAQSNKLHQLAELDAEPPRLNVLLPRGLAILAAVLCGLGLIFWVAANWEKFGRFGRFALLQGAFLAACLGALYRPAARTPLALLAFLAIGGLFAYFGQTYQTGADTWQLFALWAALGLPLCLAVRNDLLWAPWALVTQSAISLWIHAHTGHAWRLDERDLSAHLIGWSAALLVTLALSPVLERFTGAKLWAMRASLTFAIIVIGITAMMALFQREIAPHYYIGLCLLSAFALAFATKRLFDVFVLSVIGIALNGLIVGGVAHALFADKKEDAVGALFLMGIFGTILLSATVNLILRRTRQIESQGASA